MEKLVNKKVRLRHRVKGTNLVACSDKESVNHIKLDDNKPKPENSVWVIKSKNPDKSVRLESVYGNSLGYKISKGFTVFQMDNSKSSSSSSSGDNESSNKLKWHIWWKLEEVDNSGFSMVQIHLSKFDVYLYPDIDTPLVKLRKGDFSWWCSWLLDGLFHWEIEIVKTPIIRKDQIIRNPEETHAPHQVEKHVGEIPSPGYTYQVNRMYVRNIYKANPGETQNPSIPFINNDVNTGRNVNESGTQIVGGAIVQTRIENFVNNNIVSRNNA